MSSLDRQGEKVWRSLAELARTTDAAQAQPAGEGALPHGQEFADGASSPPDGPTRRRFLQLMAASAGLAGLAGCRSPKESILPYARRPPEITPGEPLQFATAAEIAGQVQGLVVTSYDGRPIKVDGNPLHPINQGSSNVFAQASVLDLYDPDRSKNPIQLDRRGGKPTYFDRTWNEFDEFAQNHFIRLRQQQGEGLCVLAEPSSSPSLADLLNRFRKTYPKARWFTYEPISRENERTGSIMAFDKAHRTQYSLDKAQVIVSLDSDFLLTHPASLKLARDFIKGHTPASDKNNAMSRLYVVEPTYTITGAMADNRLAVKARDVWAVACNLAAALHEAGLGQAVLPELAVPSQPIGEAATRFVQAMAKDLLAAPGNSAILVGHAQPAELHALSHVLNAALGNVGRTVTYTAEPTGQDTAQLSGLQTLAAEMAAGKVATLLTLGGNPAYDAPEDVRFAFSLTKVPTTIHLSDYWNETSQLCTWHIPQAHYLESWGDVRSYDGTYSVAQPLIAPLYNGRSTIEVFSSLSEEPPRTGHEIVRRTVRQAFAGQADDGQFEDTWRKLLNDGMLAETQYQPIQPELRRAEQLKDIMAQLPGASQTAASDTLELVFREDPRVYDGRFANNAWLQEMPDSLAKLTWDNAAIVSPHTAAALKIRHEQVVTLQLAGRSVTAPVYVMPGQADGSVTVHLGYGRKMAGQVGNGVGFDAYALRTTAAMHFGDGLTVTPTSQTRAFAVTQEHWPIDRIGREGAAVRLEHVAVEMTLADWRKDPDYAKKRAEHAPPIDLWKRVEYPGYRWGMAIDLHKCIGCNACSLACQAENNVPVVGRDQVRRQREMHWLRIDRYFRGEPADLKVTFQPMFCVHCETAPCEAVCPVAATLHDADGLNLMVYNRCVGTRYCSNNCPYKVRRFNFYSWNKNVGRLEAMVKNPDVTVRGRGVMEKCTYCVQRIQRARIRAKNERRSIATDEFTTACAQACQTGALVFGNLEDPNAAVTKLQHSSRSYAVLVELNTQPRSLHMVRVRNPNPQLADMSRDRKGAEDR